MPTATWERLPPEKRDAIVAAAEAEFAARGFSRGSLNVVAREAGIAKGSLFQYFDDKLDLFTYLSELASLRIAVAMAKHNAPLPWREDFFGALTDSFDAWVAHFERHPVDLALTAAVNLELDTDTRVAVREVVNRHYLRGLRHLVDLGVEVGALRAEADREACLALLLLVLPHLALAANMPGLDPVLDLHVDSRSGVRRIVGVLRDAFGAAPATARASCGCRRGS